MTTPDATWLRHADPSRTAFFLDVDGTLLGFKERPGDVVADDRLRDVLRTLQAAAGQAVAFVSGRAVDDLDRIMAPLVLPAGGVHGADLRLPDGQRIVEAGAALDRLRADIGTFVAGTPGVSIEDKGAALAIHFRQAPEREEAVMRFLEQEVDDPALMVQHGKMVAEIKPRNTDKGTAIRALMACAPFKGRVPFFIGDDLTDEHGFRVVNALEGISVKVGHPDEPTVARYRVGSVEGAVQSLADLAGCK